MTSFSKADLEGFAPRHKTFVGIDSDGCVFDSMEIKQKRCFHGLIASHWHLEAVEKQLRETAEFVNLYSRWRGQNRFVTLILTFDLLRERPEVKAAGVQVPSLSALKAFIDTGVALGNPELEKAVATTGNEELASLLRWSKAVNREIEQKAANIPPFPWAVECLKRISQTSDAICVSQTPTEALMREWKDNDLMGYIRIIAGQELGTKTEHLQMATSGRYPADHILMIGDAPGDKKAAKANNCLFYPINPGHENASWENLHKEAYDRFLAGTYRGAYEDALVREFEALLPETPPWQS